MFEMARSGIGKLEEVRRASQQFLEVTPTEYRNYRATVELMSLETYFYNSDYQKVIDLGKAFIEEYPDIRREYGMALIWIAIGHTYLKDYVNAIDWFFRALDADLDPDKDYFRKFDNKQFSLNWLQYIFTLPPH